MQQKHSSRIVVDLIMKIIACPTAGLILLPCLPNPYTYNNLFMRSLPFTMMNELVNHGPTQEELLHCQTSSSTSQIGSSMLSTVLDLSANQQLLASG